MNNYKITLLYFRAVSPLLFFISLFNELSFFFLSYRGTRIFPWEHLIQSLAIILTGYLLMIIPAFVYTNRMEETAASGDSVPGDLKLLTFLGCMRSLSILNAVIAFIMIVLPRLTGFFFIEISATRFVFISRTVLDMIISLCLWSSCVFLSLFFFKTGIEKQSEIFLIRKYSHLHVRKNFSFAFVLLFGILQSFLITAVFTLSGGLYFAENAVVNPSGASPATFLLTGIVSGGLTVVLLILFLRVFHNLQKRKILRTISLLKEIRREKNCHSPMTIITLDEFGDLCESINLLMENAQSVAAEFQSKTASLRSSLTNTVDIYEKTEEPLCEMVRCSQNSAASNAQINALSRTDKNVHNLNSTAKMMEAQINAQEELIGQTSVSIGQMTSSIAAIIQTIQTATRLADKLKNYSATGNSAIEEAGKAIEEIQEAARSVSEILAIIQRIAAQTNLLSMNASIEAAHAGKSGSGFALVAQSVRTLADASTKSAKKIETHIGEMSEWIQIATQTIGATVKTFSTIQKGINENSQLIGTISSAMTEEETAARDTMTAIESVVSSVKSIKTKFQTQKEAAINVEETMTLIIDLSDRMQQLLSSESEMTETLKQSVESTISGLERSQVTLAEIERTVGQFLR